MRVGVLGTGLQARRRVEALNQSKEQVVFVGSGNLERAKQFAGDHNVESYGDYEHFVKHQLDTIIITTTPEKHFQLASLCLRNSIPFLCEKPITMSSDQAHKLLDMANKKGIYCKVGFNHRYHPAFQEAYNLHHSNFGKLLQIHAYYGIIGRPDYREEWRSNVDQSAGGILMELGIHIIDLCRWFAGPLREGVAHRSSQIFDIKPFEDTASVIMLSDNGCIINLNTNLMTWKNRFNFEMIYEDGYVEIDGLGQSYGTQKLIVGKKDYNAPFSYNTTEFRGGDRSWFEEWKSFKKGMQQPEKSGNLEDGVAAMSIVEELYNSSTVKASTRFKLG